MLRLLRIAMLLVLPGLFLIPSARAEEDKATGLDLSAIFKKLDTDGDGKLSADEFKKVADLPEVKEKLKAAPAKAGFDLEKFKDKLTPEQFEKLKERLTPERLEKLKERFGGNIDAETLKKLLERLKNKNP